MFHLNLHRRAFLRTGSMAMASTMLPSGMRSLFNSNYEMKLLRRNVGIFKEKGGTIGWLIQPEGIVVVDSQWKEQAENLLGEIKKKQEGPVEYLINTHHHGDHTSGNIAFKGIAKHVLAHENSKRNQESVAKANNTTADQLFPDMTFADRWQKKVGDETIDIQYWGPGHTNGDIIIHFQQANVVHCGDLVFNRRYPYIDKSAGAMIDNWIEILQQMQSYFDKDTLFIFGHAREEFELTGNKDDLVAYADYLSALLEFVEKEIKSGRTKDEIMAATAIPGAPEWTGDGIQRSLTAALQEFGVE